MREPPRIIFLDQNKWIDLAHAFESQQCSSDLFQLGSRMVEAVNSRRVLFPLTANIIVETYKMANADHRKIIAEVQAQLSQGYVFRNRNFHVRHELFYFLGSSFGINNSAPPYLWWLSKYFVEAFVDIPTAISELGLEINQINDMRSNPKYALYHFLSAAPPTKRVIGMAAYDATSDKIIQSITSRISKLDGQSMAIRKRAYTATLALDEFPRITSVASTVGKQWRTVSDIGISLFKCIMREIPAYAVEIELASRIESLHRPINRNDLRDMQAYTAAIPYADAIVGETLFINIVKQGRLDKRFPKLATTDIFDIDNLL